MKTRITPGRWNVVFARGMLLAAVGLLSGCGLMPVSVQSRVAAARLGMSGAEVSALVRQVSSEQRLRAQWVNKVGEDTVEIGVGDITPVRSVVYRRVDGRWVEDVARRAAWGPGRPAPVSMNDFPYVPDYVPNDK